MAEVAKYRPNAAVVVLGALVPIAYLVIRLGPGAAYSGRGGAYYVGQMVGMFLGVFIVSYLAFRVFRRSNLAASVGLLAAIGVQGVQLGRSVAADRTSAAVAIESRGQELKQLADEARSATASGDVPKMRAASEQAVQKMETLGKEMKGPEKIVMEVGAQFAREGQEAAGEADKAAGAWLDAGGNDVDASTTLEVLNKRIALLEEAEKWSDRTKDYLEQMPERFDEALKARGLSDKERREAVAGMVHGAGPVRGVAARFRACQSRVFAKSREVTTMLRDNFGKWSVKGDQLTFDGAPEGTAAKYNQLQDELVKEAQNEAAIVEEFKNAAKQQGRKPTDAAGKAAETTPGEGEKPK